MLRQWNKPVDLKEKHDMNTRCGLLAPNGQLFGCEYGQHSRLAARLSNDEISDYSIYGFIHLDDAFDKPHFEVSQAQLNTIFSWCQKHKEPFPYWTGLDRSEAAA